MKNNFYREREISCIDRTDEIVSNLPYYVKDFFVGIEPRTTPLTRLNYAYDLRVFYDFLVKKVFRNRKPEDIELSDIANLTSTDIEYFLSYLSHYEINNKIESCTENGKARKLSTLRSFFKHLFNKNMIPSNIASKVSMPKLHDKEIIRLESDANKDEVGDLLYVVESGNGLTKRQSSYHNLTRIRDCAIITLFLGTGIRISELVGLNVEDFDFKTNSFIVTRKGGNRAVLYFNDEVASALSDYIEKRKIDLENSANPEENAMFLSLQLKRISTRQVQELVKKYAKIISPLKKITPHKLRSTYGTNLYRQTKDIYVVANCLGHSDVNTTKKHYAAITEDVRKNAAQTYSISNKDKK